MQDLFEGSILPWIKSALSNHTPPYILGINGPQGSGKTTLSRAICEKLEADGLKALTISVDDFYLTRAEQVNLASQQAENLYLQQRGYPGTHDLALGTKTLRSLKSGESETRVVSIPRYDKSAHQGQGDRAPASEWTRIAGPIDLVILEGWMLGFKPVDESALPNSSFKIINQRLSYYHAWHELLDGFLQLEPDDYHHVLHWRVEAEEKMKAAGKPGMSTAEVQRYIELFLPAYKTYLPTLAHPPGKAHLKIPIGKGRLPR